MESFIEQSTNFLAARYALRKYFKMALDENDILLPYQHIQLQTAAD